MKKLLLQGNTGYGAAGSDRREGCSAISSSVDVIKEAQGDRQQRGELDRGQHGREGEVR